jgi:hypothetical protein
VEIIRGKFGKREIKRKESALQIGVDLTPVFGSRADRIFPVQVSGRDYGVDQAQRPRLGLARLYTKIERARV